VLDSRSNEQLGPSQAGRGARRPVMETHHKGKVAKEARRKARSIEYTERLMTRSEDAPPKLNGTPFHKSWLDSSHFSFY
jgi:hypothetical protein